MAAAPTVSFAAFPPRTPERAQDSERLCALHYRERHRAVDQEHADDERQQSERAQVGAERCRQLAERAALGFGGDQDGVAGAACASRARACASVSAKSMRLIRSERCRAALAPSRCRPRSAARLGRRHRSSARRRAPAPRRSRAPTTTPSVAPASTPSSSRELLRQQDGVGLGDQPPDLVRARVVPRAARTRAASSHRLDAEQRHAQFGSTRDADLGFDDGCGERRLARHEIAKDPLVEAAAERQDSMRDRAAHFGGRRRRTRARRCRSRGSR